MKKFKVDDLCKLDRSEHFRQKIKIRPRIEIFEISFSTIEIKMDILEVAQKTVTR